LNIKAKPITYKPDRYIGRKYCFQIIFNNWFAVYSSVSVCKMVSW